MKFFAFIATLLVLCSGVAHAGQNGGATCVGCTALVALVEQSMQIKKISAQTAISDLCSYLPGILSIACDVAIEKLSEKVIPLIEAGENPDAVCHSLGFCVYDTAVCRLFPANMTEREFVQHTLRLRQRHNVAASFNICTIIPGVCAMEKHEPFSDNDGDLFSTEPRLRGSDWRGKDCDDSNRTIFPGRNSHDRDVDENCNGIYGVDSTTGQSYEDLYCGSSGAMGVAALGDSATAHFRIPPNYVTASKLSKETFAHLLDVVMNEADWPMLSWSTGHMNTSNYSPDIEGPMKSLYSLLNERNRCNHRDYQNIGVNGARVSDLVTFDTVLSRNRKDNVKPLLMIYSMVGNDVCNGHPNFDSMTTPAQYYNRILSALQLAETFLPNGSHVVLVPLVDGRILYDTMHARIHPIGSTNNDVTYEAFYDYLNCVQVSPCWGWMNSNETVRNTTWKIASSLNAQLPKLVNDTKGQFSNFQLHYFGNIYDDAIETFPLPLYELIEPVDGFHPSQYGNAWIGEYLFNKTLEAGILGKENPYNADIVAKFGDQGGY